jgi:DNA replication and repair protein RecF
MLKSPLMLLERLEAWQFRNLSGVIELQPQLNILVGENGHGKTNLLEAAAVLASGRSFRTPRLQEAIEFGSTEAFVRGRVRESQEISREIQVAITPTAKTLLINQKKEPSQRYLGHLHTIVFNSDELEIVRGQPEARRRFLDAGIVSLHPPFVQVFSDYARVLKQKNALLQKARDDDQAIDSVRNALEPWNTQLAKLAGRIHRGRIRFVERLNGVLEKRFFGREELSIRYVSSLEGKGDLAEYETLISERLSLRVQAEVVAGRALIGPHRDDLEITFDGHDARRFGSAGQQRSALLLLLLANMSVFHSTRGEYPVVLLDDIDAELDHRRIGQLLDFLSDKCQTVVTTSKEHFVREFGSSAAVFTVRDGRAEKLANA